MCYIIRMKHMLLWSFVIKLGLKMMMLFQKLAFNHGIFFFGEIIMVSFKSWQACRFGFSGNFDFSRLEDSNAEHENGSMCLSPDLVGTLNTYDKQKTKLIMLNE